MTTDVRLLSTYQGFPPQSIISLPDALATAFVAAGNASLTLTGGTRQYRKVAERSRGAIMVPIGTLTVAQNETVNVLVLEGYSANITGDATAVGTVTRNGSSDAWAVAANTTTTIGPYTGDQVLVMSATAGSITAKNKLTAGTTPVKSPSGMVLGMGSADTDALTNPSAVFNGAKLRRKTLGNLRNGLLNQVALTSGAFNTHLHEAALSAPSSAVRFHTPNSHPTASPQMRLSFGYSEIAGDPTAALNTLVVGGVPSSTAGAWTTALRNGASAWSQPAVDGSTVNRPFYATTDWMFGESLTRADAGRTNPIIKVIHEFGGYENLVPTATTTTVQAASVGITGWESDTDISVPPYGRIHRTRTQAVAGGVDPTLVTSTTADNSATNYHSPTIIEYALRTGFGLQFIILGDSEAEGTGDTIDKFGHLYRALLPLSTARLPIDVINAAQAGTNTSNWVTMAESIIPLFPNSIVIVPNMSPNNAAPLGNAINGAAIVSAGSGGTPGAVTLTGTTGTGTPFQATGTIGSDGALQSVNTISVQGNYTVLPSVIQAEPVTGGGLTGCTLNLRITGATLSLLKRDISRIKAICDQYSCAMVMLTCLPSNTAGKDWKGSDPIRQQINADTIASGELYIDVASIVNGVTTGNQIQMLAGTTLDQLHLSPTGHALVAASASGPFFKKITG